MKPGHTFSASIIVLVLSINLTGCATLLSKREYEVMMVNTGGPTYFSVHNHNNEVVKSGMTPQKVTLKAKAAPFKRAKYQVVYAGTDGVQRQELKADVDWWTAGNIIIGGLAVDASTGALWKLDPRVTGQISPDKIVSNNTQGAAVLAAYSQGGSPAATAGRTPNNIQPASYGSGDVQQQQRPSF